MSVEVGVERVEEWEEECRRGKSRKESVHRSESSEKSLEEWTGVCLVCLGVTLLRRV